MAHKKATGSKATQGGNVAGKRRGVKVFAGTTVTTGSILVRQKGNVFHPGVGVGQGRDFTLFAEVPGIVKYTKKLGRRIVSIGDQLTAVTQNGRKHS